MSNLTVQEMLQDKKIQQLADYYNRLDAILKAL